MPVEQAVSCRKRQAVIGLATACRIAPLRCLHSGMTWRFHEQDLVPAAGLKRRCIGRHRFCDSFFDFPAASCDIEISIHIQGFVPGCEFLIQIEQNNLKLDQLLLGVCMYLDHPEIKIVL
jgi:hypothetical protein